MKFKHDDSWDNLREVVWKRADGCCEFCGNPGRDVHHVRYRSVTWESDVLLLCRRCHLWCHGRTPANDNQKQASNDNEQLVFEIAAEAGR